jgi:hypothetical protein
MKKIRYTVIFVLSIIALGGCSSTPPLDLDNQIWFGTVTRPENDATFARLTFSQKGKNVEGTLELGETPDTLIPDSELIGVLEGSSLNMSTDTRDTSIFGNFNRDGTTFSGTLRFTEEGEDDDFTLTLTYQQEAASIQ